MKRSISFTNSNREATASRPKRIRSKKPTEEKENLIDANTNVTASDRENVIKKIPQNSKQKSFNDNVSRDNQSRIIGSTPSGSTISFSSSPSLSTNTPLATNGNKKYGYNSNSSLQ